MATTTAVLEFIRLHQPEASLVIPSSVGVYSVVKSASIRVDQSLTPISPYGVHKKIVEELCQSYARHFGLHCAIVRLFSVYGIAYGNNYCGTRARSFLAAISFLPGPDGKLAIG